VQEHDLLSVDFEHPSLQTEHSVTTAEHVLQLITAQSDETTKSVKWVVSQDNLSADMVTPSVFKVGGVVVLSM
jgi:hypothetical protein